MIKAQTAEEFRKQDITMRGVLPADEETKKILFSDELAETAKELLDVLEKYLQKISK